MAAQLNDEGTMLEITMYDCDNSTGRVVKTILDISTASTLTILLKKPDNTVLTKTGVLSNTGTDGKMHYITLVNELDIEGTWQIQGRVVFPDGTWSSTKGTFEVEDNLD